MNYPKTRYFGLPRSAYFVPEFDRWWATHAEREPAPAKGASVNSSLEGAKRLKAREEELDGQVDERRVLYQGSHRADRGMRE